MNLIERITEAILTDDDNTTKNSERLLDRFVELTKKEQEAVDIIFITLCGYSLSTMAKHHKLIK